MQQCIQPTGTNRPRAWFSSCSCSLYSAQGASLFHRFPVVMAVGKHPFPYRTRQLSPPAPMVLGGEPPGRVGRRRDSLAEAPLSGGASARLRPWNQRTVSYSGSSGRRSSVKDGRSDAGHSKKRPQRADDARRGSRDRRPEPTPEPGFGPFRGEIGRASCRERV